MPVRINLKELFGSDSQEISIDKLNFNFNKLLELGIGLKGAPGITGGQGAIGPAGVIGLKGDKGNQWFVGSGNPNSQVFPGLMDEDFFANSDDSQIWQYDLATDNWGIIIDLENIVVNYLSTSGTTFVRGYGEGSPDDSRYIVFPNRGNTLSDLTGDNFKSGATNNDVLLLNNFNEKEQISIPFDIATTIDGQVEYTALQKIFVDFTDNIYKRYHMEFGSLFTDQSTSDLVLSNVANNLKIRHSVDAGIIEDHLYKGIFSMTMHEAGTPNLDILANGIFEFQSSKFQNAPTVQSQTYVQIGSRYGLNEIAPYVRFDGINFQSSGLQGGLGLSLNTVSTLNDVDLTDYLMIDTGNETIPIGLHTNVHQDGGNIRQLSSTEFREITTSAPSAGSKGRTETYGVGGMFIIGNTIYTVNGYAPVSSIPDLNDAAWENGSINRWDIRDKTAAIEMQSNIVGNVTHDGSSNKLTGGGLCDIEVVGDYLYMVNNLPTTSSNYVSPGGDTYQHQHFQIARLKVNERLAFLGRIGATDGENHNEIDGDTTTLTSQSNRNYLLNGAWRIKVQGSYAFVATNKLRNFGDANTGTAGSHWGTTGSITYDPTGFGESLTEYTGRGAISAINISDPSNPRRVFTENEQSAHHLDMAVSEDYIATITLTVGADSSGMGWNGHVVDVKVYDINQYASDSEITIALDNSNQIYTDATLLSNATSQLNASVNKFGSVQTDGRNIYAMYKNNLWIYTKYEEGSGNAAFEFKGSLEFDGDVNTRVIDSVLVGRSLYVLVGQGGTDSYDSSTISVVRLYLENQSTAQFVSKKVISGVDYASSIEMTGNNLYVMAAASGAKYNLVTLEVDGLETEAANIHSLKSSNVNVSNDLRVGNVLDVKSAINVGPRGINSKGGIYTEGQMANMSKIWYSETRNISSAGVITTLNESHGKFLNSEWRYKVTLVSNLLSSGATYIVYRNLSGDWETRLVSAYGGGITTYRPILEVSPSPTGAFPNQVKLSHGFGSNLNITSNVEATYVGDKYGTIHTMGADAMWQMLPEPGSNDLTYTDGDVRIGESLVMIGSSGTFTGFTAAAASPDVTYTLPTTAPTGGQYLQHTAGNQLEWGTIDLDTAGGWTDDGTHVRLTTTTDRVAIGSATTPFGFKASITATGGTQGGLIIENTGAGSAYALSATNSSGSGAIIESGNDNALFVRANGAQRFSVKSDEVKSVPDFIAENRVAVNTTNFDSTYNQNYTMRIAGRLLLDSNNGSTNGTWNGTSIDGGTFLKVKTGRRQVGSATSSGEMDVTIGQLPLGESTTTPTSATSNSNPTVNIRNMSGGNYAELNFVRRTSNGDSDPIVGAHIRLDSNPSDGGLSITSTLGKDVAIRGDGGGHIYMQPKRAATADGYVSIGSFSTPEAMLHVRDSRDTTYAARLQNTSSADDAYGVLITTGGNHSGLAVLNVQSAGLSRFIVRGDGDIEALGGNVHTPSDISMKKDVEYLTSSLSKILNLKPVTFKWKEDLKMNPRMNRGFIAQDLIEVYPDLIKERDGVLSVNYGGLISELVMSTKEQHAIIEEKQTKIEELEARLKAIEDKLGI